MEVISCQHDIIGVFFLNQPKIETISLLNSDNNINYTLKFRRKQIRRGSWCGIRSIFKARKTLAPHGGKVLLVNPQPQIQKVLDMVKAVPLNEIFSSTAEADTYLDLMQRRVLEAGEDED